MNLTESNLKLRDWTIGYDYFISYSHKDGLDYPLALKRALESEGFRACLDQEDFFPGQSLAYLTKRRIRASKYLIVIGRPYALTKSKWVPKEVAYYIGRFDDAMPHGPIIIDVNESITKVISETKLDAIRSGSLAHQLTNGDWLRINEELLEGDNTPSEHVIGELKRAYRGVRAESRQLRILSSVSVFLLVLAVGLCYAAWSAWQLAILAEAEQIGSNAVTTATALDPQIGFAGSAFAEAAEALAQRETTGTLNSASRVIQLSPHELRYAPIKVDSLYDLAVVGDEIFVTEGTNKLHKLDRESLSKIKTLTPDSLGLDSIGAIEATDSGPVILGRTRGTWWSPGVDQPFSIPGWAKKVDFDSTIGGILYSTQDAGVFLVRPGDTDSTVCSPMNGQELFTFAAFGDGTAVMLTHGRRTINLLHVNMINCSLIKQSTIDDTYAYRLLANPKSKSLVIHTTEQLVVLDGELNVIQNLPENGISIWRQVSVNSNLQVPVEGIVTGHRNGNVNIYTISKSGHVNLTESSNSILPGQIQDIVWDKEAQRLVLSGRQAYFVTADAPGVLATLPLTIETHNGVNRIHFAKPDPTKTLASFPSFARTLFTSHVGSRVFYGLTDGSIFRLDSKYQPLLIEKADKNAGRPPYSLQALSAFGNVFYTARRVSDNHIAISQIDNGRETLLLEVKGDIDQLVATPVGFIYRVARKIFHFEKSKRESTSVPVNQHNGTQGQQTVVVSPDGKWVVFGLFKGFEIRSISSIDSQGDCIVDPNLEEEGVIAAFSHDSQYLALGTWEGLLSLWEKTGDCWSKTRDFAADRGTMVKTLAFSHDNKRLISSRRQSPPRTQIWNVHTGARQGPDFITDARAVLDSGEDLILIRTSDVASLDLASGATIERLCQVASGVIKAGLIEYDEKHPCIR